VIVTALSAAIATAWRFINTTSEVISPLTPDGVSRQT
jgi:hypothetical protein